MANGNYVLKQVNFAFVTTSLVGVVFVFLATLCVVELSSRISTESFVYKKIDTVEKRVSVAGEASTSQGDGRNALLTYQALLDDLEHLSLTGAENSRQTIYAIRDRISADAAKRNASRQIQILKERQSATNAKLAETKVLISNTLDDIERSRGLSDLRRDGLISQRTSLFKRLSAEQEKHQVVAEGLAIKLAQADAELNSGGTVVEGVGVTSAGAGPRYRQLMAEAAAIERELVTVQAAITSLTATVSEIDSEIEKVTIEDKSDDEQERLRGYQLLLAEHDQLRAEEGEISSSILEFERSFSNEWNPSVYIEWNRFAFLPSDLLLAFTVIFCGGIGAIFTAGRSRSPKYFNAIFNGVVAGFVAFLVLKGGRFLFLIDFDSTSSAFINPFSAAFSGIMAGLFTERAYLTLSELADKLSEKAVGADDGGKKTS